MLYKKLQFFSCLLALLIPQSIKSMDLLKGVAALGSFVGSAKEKSFENIRAPLKTADALTRSHLLNAHGRYISKIQTPIELTAQIDQAIDADAIPHDPIIDTVTEKFVAEITSCTTTTKSGLVQTLLMLNLLHRLDRTSQITEIVAKLNNPTDLMHIADKIVTTLHQKKLFAAIGKFLSHQSLKAIQLHANTEKLLDKDIRPWAANIHNRAIEHIKKNKPKRAKQSSSSSSSSKSGSESDD